MGVRFTRGRWEKIREDARRWWAGELKRPLIQMTLSGRDPGRPAPVLPPVPKTAYYDFDIPAADVVDRWDYDLSGVRFLGDAFPSAWPNFGPGVLAAFLGAKTEIGADTVWFIAPEDRPVSEVDLRFDPHNAWFKRVRDICRTALERWEGLVQVSMTDLGGNLDILSAFRPGEKLLLDLYDDPDGVRRLTWRAHEMWWRCYDEINAVLQPGNPGYTAWTPIYSEAPYYILQCDFCYMIGPGMFDEFVKPELVASCRRLANAFYHLDGPGQLPHLDSLLRIEELKGVQWVPGAGQPDVTCWPEVYRKIRDAGKRIQFRGTPETFETVVDQLGSAEGLVFMCSASVEDEAEAMAFLKKYRAV